MRAQQALEGIGGGAQQEPLQHGSKQQKQAPPPHATATTMLDASPPERAPSDAPSPDLDTLDVSSPDLDTLDASSLVLGDCLRLVLVCSSPLDCYTALGVLHQRYRSIGGLKDYISTPKPNHYQSLHTRVLGPGGQMVQLILRTQPMHQVAEQGIIAHWRQQAGQPHQLSGGEAGLRPLPPLQPTKSGRRYSWLQSLQHIADASEVSSCTDNPPDPLDSSDTFKNTQTLTKTL